MSKLNISDFEIGDQVVHVTNRSTVMVVIQIDNARNEIKCRWVDKKATSQTGNFLPQELDKYKHDPLGGLYLL